MTENVNTDLGSVVEGSVAPQNVTNVHAEEKLLRQSEVNEIVGREKKNAYERGKNEAILSSNKNGGQYSNYSDQMVQNKAAGANFGNMTPDESYLRQIAAQEAQRLYQSETMNKYASDLVSSFNQKMVSAQEKYPELGKELASLNLENNTYLVSLTSNLDNAADVIHDLATNPEKLVTLKGLVGISPQLAEASIRKMSESMKNNQKGLEAPVARPPLSQIKSSPVGTGDGEMTVNDWKKKYRV